MRVVTGILPETIYYTARSYFYAPVCGVFFSAVLSIEQTARGGMTQRDTYAVEEWREWEESRAGILSAEVYASIVCQSAARTFVVCKAESTGKPEEGLYLVSVFTDRRFSPSCQCFGFNRWGNCKHTDCFADLIRRGEL